MLPEGLLAARKFQSVEINQQSLNGLLHEQLKDQEEKPRESLYISNRLVKEKNIYKTGHIDLENEFEEEVKQIDF